jgi:hypothetical protein
MANTYQSTSTLTSSPSEQSHPNQPATTQPRRPRFQASLDLSCVSKEAQSLSLHRSMVLLRAISYDYPRSSKTRDIELLRGKPATPSLLRSCSIRFCSSDFLMLLLGLMSASETSQVCSALMKRQPKALPAKQKRAYRPEI